MKAKRRLSALLYYSIFQCVREDHARLVSSAPGLLKWAACLGRDGDMSLPGLLVIGLKERPPNEANQSLVLELMAKCTERNPPPTHTHTGVINGGCQRLSPHRRAAPQVPTKQEGQEPNGPLATSPLPSPPGSGLSSFGDFPYPSKFPFTPVLEVRFLSPSPFLPLPTSYVKNSS